MSTDTRRHVAFCRDTDCEYCQHLRAEMADMEAEAREDEMRAMESRYEDERDGWFR